MTMTVKQPKRQMSKVTIWTLRVLLVAVLIAAVRMTLVGWYLHPQPVQALLYVLLGGSVLGLIALDDKGR